MSPRALLLGTLSLPWFLHSAVIVLSLLGARPLASRGFALALLEAALLATFALVTRLEGASKPLAAGPALPKFVAWPLAALCASAAAVSLLGLVFALLLPIVAYDALWYRVPAIAQWLDAGRIAWVVSDDPFRNGYPLGQEAVSAVVAAATGSLRCADATSFFYVVSGALSVVVLAEACGVRRSFALAAASLFLLAPMTILNASSGYSDAAFAGATIALLCNATLLSSERSPRAAVALTTGMAGAHVLALKGTGLGFMVAVVAAVMLRTFLGRARRAAFTEQRAVFAAALLFALPGAFFALRDLAHTGNPLWPVQIRIAGHTLLPGVASMDDILDIKSNTPAELVRLPALLRVLHNWLQLHGPALVFDDRAAGLGWAWPLYALPALAALIARAAASLLRPNARLRAFVQRDALFVVLLTALCFALQPMAWWARYTLWLWGAGALALALEAEHWMARRRFLMLALGSAALCMLCVTEAALAAARADGAALALRRWLALETRDPLVLSDPRRGLNAEYWPAPEFFALGLEREPDVCRGAWKAETDDAIVDGVFAQFNPRPRVHVLADDDGDWPRVRNAWQAAGCSRLLLLRGSRVLAAAEHDPSVRIERVQAFDPLFVVRSSELARGGL